MRRNNFIRTLLVIALPSCGVMSQAQVEYASDIQAKVDTVQGKMQACVEGLNQTDDAKYVNSHIMVLMPNNANANKLYNSSEKITDEQIQALEKFRESSLSCRVFVPELPSPALMQVYIEFYSAIDAVYKDLIDKKITIGVANQERAMRIEYARSRWFKILQSEKASMKHA